MIRRTSLALAAMLALAGPARAADAPRRMDVGVNMSWLNYYGTQQPFANAFANAGPFWWAPLDSGTFAAPPGLPAWTADADGYPTSAVPYTHADGHPYGVRTAPFLHNGARYPAGTYTLRFDGTGTLLVGPNGSTPADVPFAQAGATPQAFAFDVKAPGNGGISLTIARSDPADHVRNIRLYPPGLAEVAEFSPWHPEFIGRLQGHRIVRFKDFQKTEQTSVVHWADRTTPTSYTQAGPNGVALEHCVDLCNAIGADAWINVPTSASDDYVAGMAALVRDRLKPGLKVYVEYGNECWNWSAGFYAGYMRIDAWAKANGFVDAKGNAQHTQATAALAKHAWRIWTDAFGADRARVVRVCAGQLGNPAVLDQMAAWLTKNADPGDPGWGFDAMSAAYYFGPAIKGYDATTTARQVALDSAAAAGSPAFVALVKATSAVRDKYATMLGRKVPLVGYEGGPSIVPGPATGPAYAAMVAASDDPAMYTATRRWLAVLEANGVDGVCNFDFIDPPSQYGTYGIFGYQGQPATPRHDALMDYLRGR